MESGLVPQLPLEAAIAAAGGFDEVAAGAVAELAHMRLQGGIQIGSYMPVTADPAELAAKAMAGLKRLVAAYDNPATPYLSRLIVKFQNRPGDYDHLARVAEWSAAGAEE